MKFIIIGIQRSGTIMLTAFLNSHPQLTCYAEEGAQFLEELKDNEGSNLKYNHILPNTPLQNYKILHLIRKDLFALSLSKVINKHQSKYGRPAHIFNRSKAEDLEFPISSNYPKRKLLLSTLPQSAKSRNKQKSPVKINPWEIRWEMLKNYYQVTRWNEKLKKYDPLVINYEDITQGGEVNVMPQPIADNVCDFLGVKHCQLTTSMKKVNPKNYEDYIVNWKKISKIGGSITKKYQNKIEYLIK
ncbi:hypothetical protein ACFL04_02150 [Patescibacteria group bacterium]